MLVFTKYFFHLPNLYSSFHNPYSVGLFQNFNKNLCILLLDFFLSLYLVLYAIVNLNFVSRQ